MRTEVAEQLHQQCLQGRIGLHCLQAIALAEALGSVAAGHPLADQRIQLASALMRLRRHHLGRVIHIEGRVAGIAIALGIGRQQRMLRLAALQQHLHAVELVLLDGGVTVGHALDRCLAILGVAGLRLGRDQHHAGGVHPRQHAGVIRLSEILQVMHGPAEEAIAPVRMAAGEGQARQTAVLIDAPVRQGLPQVGRRGEDQRRLVVVTDMKRRLGGILEARIAERLRTEVVALADGAGVVAEQVDVVTVVRLVRGAGYHLQGRNLLACLQAEVAPVGPGADLVEHQHILAAQQRAAAGILPWQLLDETGQFDLRIDTQGLEEGPAPITAARRLPAQLVRARRVVGEMLAGVTFLLVQQTLDSRCLVGEEGLQRLHRHLLAQLGHLAQGQQAAQRVVGPGQGMGGQAGQ